jgi:hypothetical protein
VQIFDVLKKHAIPFKELHAYKPTLNYQNFSQGPANFKTKTDNKGANPVLGVF